MLIRALLQKFEQTGIVHKTIEVAEAIGEGLRKNLVNKFGGPKVPGAPLPEVDGADVAAILLTLFKPPKKK